MRCVITTEKNTVEDMRDSWAQACVNAGVQVDTLEAALLQSCGVYTLLHHLREIISFRRSLLH